MSERNGYQPGVPCWVDIREPDPQAAVDFDTRLFGWEAEATPPSDYGAVFGWETDTFAAGDVEVTLWRLPGFVGGEPKQPAPADVIATAARGDAPRWEIDLWVDDPDATAARAADLGGTVVAGPFDTPMGRRAVLADPHGATFSISRVVPA